MSTTRAATTRSATIPPAIIRRARPRSSLARRRGRRRSDRLPPVTCSAAIGPAPRPVLTAGRGVAARRGRVVEVLLDPHGHPGPHVAAGERRREEPREAPHRHVGADAEVAALLPDGAVGRGL